MCVVLLEESYSIIIISHKEHFHSEQVSNSVLTSCQPKAQCKQTRLSSSLAGVAVSRHNGRLTDVLQELDLLGFQTFR